MTTETVAKKDIHKLQRAIVDGLEDVKAQDIQVFDTEHLSALFERVIIASGTSNRQTKALASSVRDAVRDAGFAKPRVEGETNGEWIIVDCGQAVVHVMQPSFRQYYHLEELWGEKPVRLKLGAVKPEAKVVSAPAAPVGKPLTTLKRSSAAKRGALELNPPKPKTRKPAAKTLTKAGGKPVAKPRVKASPVEVMEPVKTVVKAAVKALKKVVVKEPVKAARVPTKVVVKSIVKAKIKAPAKAAAKAPAKSAAKAPAKKAAPRKA
jgi:ribosome-associated protein